MNKKLKPNIHNISKRLMKTEDELIEDLVSRAKITISAGGAMSIDKGDLFSSEGYERSLKFSKLIKSDKYC